MTDPTTTEVEAAAEAIWRVDAPRYGNDVFPWAEVQGGQRLTCLEKARAALRTYLESHAEPPAPASVGP